MGVTDLPEWLSEIEEALENNRSSTLAGIPTIKHLLTTLKAVWEECGSPEYNATFEPDTCARVYPANPLAGTIQQIIEQGGEEGG